MKPDLVDHRRPRPKIRPLKALRHFRNLVADKEDTAEVFHIIEALNGRALLVDFEKFLASPKGAARYQEREFLPPKLDDHAALLRLPEGSVGRAYLEFMQSQGLTAAGLVAEFERFSAKQGKFDDPIEWYGNRLRDTHDLLHVLTGYSRDALGEACVLGFSYGQSKGWGVIFIAYMAAREVGKSLPFRAPVLRAVREAQKNGKLAAKVCAEDIMALLKEPLEDARARLNITPAARYHAIHTSMIANGIDPFSTISPVEKAPLMAAE